MLRASVSGGMSAAQARHTPLFRTKSSNETQLGALHQARIFLLEMDCELHQGRQNCGSSPKVLLFEFNLTAAT